MLKTTVDDFNSFCIPISPHENVPASANISTYRVDPPPLPPRRKNRSDGSAQKVQAQNAPLVIYWGFLTILAIT